MVSAFAEGIIVPITAANVSAITNPDRINLFIF